MCHSQLASLPEPLNRGKFTDSSNFGDNREEGGGCTEVIDPFSFKIKRLSYCSGSNSCCLGFT